MANKTTHMAIGAIAGLGAYALIKSLTGEKWTLGGALASVAGGAIVACVPDVLEPALHPNHRGVFHSIVLSGGIAYLNKKIHGSLNVSPELKQACAVVSASYASHLLLDAITPKSLPLV